MIDRDQAWTLCRALADRAHAGRPLVDATTLALDGDQLIEAAAGGWLALAPEAPAGWRPTTAPIAPDAAALLDLYVPLCTGATAPDLVVGHLAQSLDGRIATPTGASQFISGQADVEHAHRMRALFDAVVVGARTVELDDPRLTTRLVPGDHAVRVVLDPARRLPADHALFRDGAAPTLLVCLAARAGAARHGEAEVVGITAAPDGTLALPALRVALAARGLRRLFVEGGGVTVSRFLAAGALDRLQVAVAPVILGSGLPAFSLPPIDQLTEAIPLRCRHLQLGPDVLFDCVFPRA